MSITPRKELELDTLWLLKMIESELIDHPKNNKIKFPFNNSKVTFSETGEKPSYDRQKRIIDDLEIQKVLEFKTEERHVIYTIPTLPPPLTSEERRDPLYSFKNYASGEEVVPKQNYLIINKKKFEKIYTKYRQQPENEKKDKIKKNKEIIYQNSDKKIIKVVGKKGEFSFDTITGSVVFNKFKFNFPPEQQKFKILKVIMTSPDNQGMYKIMCQELNIKSGSSGHRTIQSVMKEIKQDLKILPKNKKSPSDIFKPVPRIGYRLILD